MTARILPLRPSRLATLLIAGALVGCARSTPQPAGSDWSDGSPFALARSRLDADHDGIVTSAEYTRRAWSSPDFAHVDADHDGDLSLVEVTHLILSTDPANFYRPAPMPSMGAPGRPGPHVPGAPGRPPPRSSGPSASPADAADPLP